MSKINKRIDQGKLLLFSMPFQLPIIPSIQLGTLCSYLKNKGIHVDTHHAYLKCADFIGPELFLIISSSMRNDILYPYFLYPKNFKKYRKKIEKYYKKFTKNFPKKQSAAFKTVLEKVSSFNEEILTKIDFSQYSLVGFSVTYDQLNSSIYFARRIKQRHPNIPIVFGGALCTEDLGISLLKTFSEIDFIVSGEGEETLTSLFLNLDKGRFDNIKGLGWRDNGTVKFNGPPQAISLENLPIPDYDDYFNTLKECSSYTKEYIKNSLFIPVEGSRGCWWRKCTFCNLNRQYIHYKEKSVEQIVNEVRNLVDKYPYHNIQFVDNVQRIKNFKELMSGLKGLNKDLDIFLEVRASNPKKDDYRHMWDAGVKRIQIGIEAFGNQCLKKMNKGVTTIENIAALKYCQEFGIVVFYNIIINYPNEEESDLQETAENVKFLKGFIPPFSVHPVGLYHGSPIFHNPKDFNINEMKIPKDNLWRFPETIRKTFIPFFYEYTCINNRKDRTLSWQDIFSAWQHTGSERIFTPLIYFQDAGAFITITDMLSGKISKTILKGIERELYLFCDSIQTKSAIIEQFHSFSPDHLEEILEKWIAKRWMFREGEKFLSLAVKKSRVVSGIDKKLKSYMLQGWTPLTPYKFNLKLGPVANISLLIDLKKKPLWLRLLKRRLQKIFN